MAKKCNHYWNVVHAVYAGPRGGTCIRRYCPVCGIEQVGMVTKWREPRPNEFETPANQENADG